MPRRETTIILAVAGLLGLLVLGVWWLTQEIGGADASAPDAVPPRDDAVIGPEADPEERVIHGSRYREADPAPEGADPMVEDAAFVVRVVDESDAPVATVSVGLCVQSADFKIGAALPTAVTDAQGIAKMKSVPSGPLRVVACAPGRMPIRVPVPLDAEEVVVRLASSPALEGVVRIDGAAPTTPIGFTVSGYREPSASWTPAERHFCRVCARNPGSIAMTTDAGGAFA